MRRERGSKVSKDTKVTKGTKGPGLRIPSRLSAEEEKLVYDVIGAAMCVHTQLGPGLPERFYQTALMIELRNAGFTCAAEEFATTAYRGLKLRGHRLDVVVNGMLIVEVKAVQQLLPIHSSQLIAYLRASGKPIGLLLNFNVEHLRDGIRRHVL